MTFQEIQELIKLLNKSNLSEFKLKDGEFQISIRTSSYNEARPAQVFATPTTPVQAAVISVAAPEVPPPASTEPKTEQLAPAAPVAPPTVSNKTLEIKSPMVGTFYRASNPEKPPLIEIGTKVKKGDVVCVIEAMKLFNEIESEVSGTVVKVLVKNAQPVEYDQPLFVVEPE